jgi:hypothetical protein
MLCAIYSSLHCLEYALVTSWRLYELFTIFGAMFNRVRSRPHELETFLHLNNLRLESIDDKEWILCAIPVTICILTALSSLNNPLQAQGV